MCWFRVWLSLRGGRVWVGFRWWWFRLRLVRRCGGGVVILLGGFAVPSGPVGSPGGLVGGCLGLVRGRCCIGVSISPIGWRWLLVIRVRLRICLRLLPVILAGGLGEWERVLLLMLMGRLRCSGQREA